MFNLEPPKFDYADMLKQKRPGMIQTSTCLARTATVGPRGFLMRSGLPSGLVTTKPVHSADAEGTSDLCTFSCACSQIWQQS